MKLFACALTVLQLAAYGDEFDELRKELKEVRDAQESLKRHEKDVLLRIRQMEAHVDKTRGVSPVCPVHKVKMSPVRAVIAYGMMGKEPSANTRRNEFPFAAKYILGGCVQSSLSPSHGRKYVCDRCADAEERWRRLHPGQE
jgi:hypothetical protein